MKSKKPSQIKTKLEDVTWDDAKKLEIEEIHTTDKKGRVKDVWFTKDGIIKVKYYDED